MIQAMESMGVGSGSTHSGKQIWIDLNRSELTGHRHDQTIPQILLGAKRVQYQWYKPTVTLPQNR